MFNIKVSFLSVLALAGMIGLSPCAAQEPLKAVSSGFPVAVNGVSIPQSRFDLLLKETLAQGQADTPELRTNLREILINQEVIAQLAQKNGSDKTAEFQTRLELSRQQVLVNNYLRDYVAAHPISDEEVKTEFDRLIKQMGSTEYKVRHILVKEESDALAIIAKLKKKVAFEKLAEESLDTGSRANGGDLGWVPAGNYVMAFADAVTHLKKGEFTDTPVHTTLGWHVIKLEDSRPVKLPPFDQAKAGLLQKMQQQQIQTMLSQLRTTTKIE